MRWLTDIFSSKREKDLALKKVKLLEQQLADREPKADEEIDANGYLTVGRFNAAYAASKRELLPPDLTQTLTDAEVVKLWTDRRNYEQEKPKLEIVHSDITADGQVQLKLDWNDAFIRLLQQRGFIGDSEDEIIQAYLHQVTKRVDTQLLDEETPDMPLAPKQPSEQDIEEILDKTNPETLRTIERSVRRRAAKRNVRSNSFDRR